MKREWKCLMRKEWIRRMTPLNHLEEVCSLSLSLLSPLSLSSMLSIYTLEQSEEEYESPFEDDEKMLQAKYDQGCKSSLNLYIRILLVIHFSSHLHTVQQDQRNRGKSDVSLLQLVESCLKLTFIVA